MTPLQALRATLAGGLIVAVASTAQPASAQIAFGGPSGVEEAARVEIYDSLRKLPRETPVSLVAQAVGPAVVYVETEMVQPVRTIMGLQNQTRNGSGSGVVIHPSGLIITNYHVVENARDIRVSFEGNPESYSAERISFVREEDLALLKIHMPEGADAARPLRLRGQNGLRTTDDPTSTLSGDDAFPEPIAFPTVRMGSSADLMPGERVVAIGSPHGQTYTVSSGIISGLHRDVTIPGRNLNFRGLIQTDASINFGNSGGPLLNIHGELIGINTVMNASAENIGFAIPVDRVRQVLEDVLFPNARRTWLGFDVEEDASGLFVSKVWPMGPAEGTGLCEGDRVLALDRTAVKDSEAYLLQSLQVDVGRPVQIEFSHGSDRVAGGGPETYTASIEGWDELNGFFFRDLGLTVQEIHLNQNRQPFLQVETVLPGSSADELGVLAGDLLQAARPRTKERYRAIALSDKATLKTILDRVPKGTEIEVDAYRDLNGDLRYSNNELLKGVLVR